MINMGIEERYGNGIAPKRNPVSGLYLIAFSAGTSIPVHSAY